MSFLLKYSPFIVVLVAGLAVVQYLSDSDISLRQPAGSPPQITTAFDDPDAQLETQSKAPTGPIDPVLSDRIMTGDVLGSQFRISAAVSIYPLGSNPTWNRTYAFRFDGRRLGPIRNLDAAGLTNRAGGRGLAASDLTQSILSN